MTPAEFKTLRESCGLSLAALAAALPASPKTGKPLDVRSVQKWEEGARGVPVDVADWLRRLDARLADAALHAAEVMGGAPAGAEVVLLRYRNGDDLARYRPDMAALGPGVHAALVDRARQAALRLGLSPRITYMDAASYEAWRTAAGKLDGEAVRAEWAGLQLDHG